MTVLPESFTTDIECPITSADYYMPVGHGGFQFVAALMAYVRPWGPQFPVPFARKAYLRAASTLAHMAIVRGETFEFLRLGVQMSQADVAALLHVTLTDVQDWESGATPIGRDIWNTMAEYVCVRDSRGFSPDLAFNDDFRARTIRVRPEAFFPPQPYVPPACRPQPCPPFGR